MNVQIKNKKIIQTILYDRYFALIIRSYLISNLNLSTYIRLLGYYFQISGDPGSFSYHNNSYIHTNIIGFECFDVYKSRNVYLKILEIVVY